MSMRRSWMAVAAAVVLGAVSSAYAASVTIDFTTSSSSGSYGADNSRTFTAGGVTLTATAWTMSTTTTSSRTQVFLGRYSAGLGVSNNTETNNQTGYNGNNEHTVDNKDGFDFVQMAFDKQVKVTAVKVNAFSVSGDTDTDITVNFGDWYSATRTSFGGQGDPATHNVSGSSSLSNTFNVWASLTSTGYIDGFKITSVTFDYTAGSQTGVVPVPRAAVLGLGLLGGLAAFRALRRRRRTDLSV